MDTHNRQQLVHPELWERIRSTSTIITATMQSYNDCGDPMLIDELYMHVEILIRLMECQGVNVTLLRRALSELQNVQDEIELHANRGRRCMVGLCTGSTGRPRLEISREQLEHLLGMNFDCTKISKLFGVSLSTIRRRMKEFGLNVHSRYSVISDQELDELVLHIKHDYPASGYRIMDGILRSYGYRIQQVRIRSCMQRVDPEGAIVRWFDTIQRRKYHVQGPLSLFHYDGNAYDYILPQMHDHAMQDFGDAYPDPQGLQAPNSCIVYILMYFM